MKSFQVVPRDLSLNEIAELGSHVTRTPHVGNLYLAHFALAQMLPNIRFILYDRMVCEGDVFHPHRIVRGEQSTLLGSKRLLASHVRTQKSFDDLPVGTKMLDIHMKQLRQVYPNTHWETQTEQFQRNPQLIESMLEVLTNIQSSAWVRVVAGDGKVSPISVTSWTDAKKIGIFGVDNPEQGLLIPNTWHVLIDAICEILETKKSQVFHLAGHDMYNYLPLKETELSGLYSHIASLLSLPSTIEFHVAVVSDLKLVVPWSHREQLDRFIEARLSGTYREMVDAMWNCCPHISYTMCTGSHRYFSQHDLQPDEGVYVPDWVRNQKMSQLGTIMGEIHEMIRLHNWQ